MARLQQSRSGRKHRTQTVGACDLKRALRTWAHENEMAPPMKFGDVRRRKRAEPGHGKEAS